MLWSLLLRDDDMSTILQRFIWAMPLKFKRKFIAAIDAHLSDRYPMFKGLSKDWPGGNYIHPYVRPAEERKNDFELVTTGYLGYRALGYSLREVDLFVWLEVLRDKQCEDRPCEQGVFDDNKRKKGGCPVVIHIPDMLNLMGQGKLKEAFTLIQASNPLPDVTGRVCPQEHQCQGVCTITGRPIEIGQLEWYLPERERLAREERGDTSARRGGLCFPVGAGREAGDRSGRFRSRRPDQRLSSVGRGLSRHGVRGVPRPRRRVALRHP